MYCLFCGVKQFYRNDENFPNLFWGDASSLSDQGYTPTPFRVYEGQKLKNGIRGKGSGRSRLAGAGATIYPFRVFPQIIGPFDRQRLAKCYTVVFVRINVITFNLLSHWFIASSCSVFRITCIMLNGYVRASSSIYAVVWSILPTMSENAAKMDDDARSAIFRV